MLCGQTLSITPSTSTYSSAGGNVTLTVRLAYTQSLSSVGIEIATVPAGWAFGELLEGNVPGIAPSRGLTGKFEFAYLNVPASPVTFTFTATYGAGLSGNQSLDGIRAVLRDSAGGAATNVTAPAIVFTAAGGGSGGNTAPAIASQPVGGAITAGQGFSFSVIATGTAPVTYQWRKDEVAIAGATSATLALTNAATSAAGGYSVVVANAVGSVISAAAVLDVRPAGTAPTITTPPRDVTGLAGSSVTLTVVAASNTPLAYQWRKDGGAISGATSSSLVLANLTAGSTGSYSVVVSNADGSVVSINAVVTVNTPGTAPTIVTPPRDFSGTVGSAVTLTVNAAGSAPLSYQWRKDGAVLNGAIASSLSLAGSLSDSGSYTVTVSNAIGSIPSSAAIVRFTEPSVPLVITQQPLAQAVTTGANVTLSAGVSGTGPNGA